MTAGYLGIFNKYNIKITRKLLISYWNWEFHAEVGGFGPAVQFEFGQVQLFHDQVLLKDFVENYLEKIFLLGSLVGHLIAAYVFLPQLCFLLLDDSHLPLLLISQLFPGFPLIVFFFLISFLLSLG